MIRLTRLTYDGGIRQVSLTTCLLTARHTTRLFLWHDTGVTTHSISRTIGTRQVFLTITLTFVRTDSTMVMNCGDLRLSQITNFYWRTNDVRIIKEIANGLHGSPKHLLFWGTYDHRLASLQKSPHVFKVKSSHRHLTTRPEARLSL